MHLHLARLVPAVLAPFLGCFLPARLAAETIEVRTDYSTIQEAIDAAVDGDEIVVEPDFYLENIDFLGKSITVRSADGASRTTINGSGLTRGAEFGSTVTFVSGEGTDSVLDGFTIADGAGSERTSSSGATILIGGGILCEESSPRLLNLVVTNNENEGIYLLDSAAEIEDVTVTGHAAVLGGGVFIGGRRSDVTMDRCLLEANSATIGGGLYQSGGTLRLTACRITGNEASFGAGLFLASDAGVSESTIDENVALVAGGGVATGDDVRIDLCEIALNEALFGAGISHSEGTLDLFRCLIWGNEAGSEGGAYRGDAGKELCVVTHSTITQNTAPSGGAFHLATSPTPSEFEIELLNSIVWNNGVDTLELADGALRGSYSVFEGGLEGAGNLDEDPLFVDATLPDFGLLADSPCVDGGDPESPLDPDGTLADMGCFPTTQVREFRRGDVTGNGFAGALSDSLHLLQWAFLGAPAPPCLDAADVDDNGTVSALLDSLYLFEWQFDDGPVPAAPGPDACGTDPTRDAVTCLDLAGC